MIKHMDMEGVEAYYQSESGCVSSRMEFIRYITQVSPRWWGCFKMVKVTEKTIASFPTLVGVQGWRI